MKDATMLSTRNAAMLKRRLLTRRLGGAVDVVFFPIDVGLFILLGQSCRCSSGKLFILQMENGFESAKLTFVGLPNYESVRPIGNFFTAVKKQPFFVIAVSLPCNCRLPFGRSCPRLRKLGIS